ncbi:hypothetical protein CAPTEDRAFT_196619 [Capitella teleta]|uniref:Kinesin motor domain-containing protein n=1 Tax=Capitella teleta TaxID=283909 RepID=R7UFS5_CAPTE|nr:hypothetical protein CAPTEDRAFT_196619 [Capitella teleta]|eukprot:ELU02132.1 hypothetical protein CAPTEDRAFT_196619 [Capitella teleta]
MKGSTTYLSDPDAPNEDARKFAYDHSYWSHDGCKEDSNGYYAADSKHANGSKFADQKTVFNDLGVGVYNNAWEGFNSTLFAYGQTGSGKSWSVVMFSMLEIYMEEVRDLFRKDNAKGGLKVRQHPKKGFYAEGLTVAPVDSYISIENKMEEGTMNRTVAATQMNATSSRAHTIVGITLIQKSKNAAGEETTKSSVINLVDLAGSERSESTGATGDRLKEGAAINTSLSALGNVIAALAEKSEGKNVRGTFHCERASNTGASGSRLKEGAAINTSLSALGNCIAALADQGTGKKSRVPFRDSMLTKLLKNALGGNSKTIMIAAISPADINYEETLSTLRYADRAKQIKCNAVVNEDPTEKLIRGLQEENERLKKMLASGGKIDFELNDDDKDEMEGLSESDKKKLKQEMEEDFKAELEENDREMEEMKKAFEDKLKAYQEGGTAGIDEIAEREKRRKTEAHLYNVNFDPQLSGKIVHFVSQPKVTVGKGDSSDIKLMGPSILEHHAVFHFEDDKYYVEKADSNARVTIDGEPVVQKTLLEHNDRVMFGTTQMFGLSIPKERDASKEKFPTLTFDMFQEEMAAKSGFDMSSDNKSRDDMLLQEDLMDVRPGVEEANSISEDLDKKKQFEMVLVSPEARGVLKGRTEVFVRVSDLETNHEWMWPREEFLNRKFVMQEMFQKHQAGENVDWPTERDPFYEDPKKEIHIGSVKVWLQSLAYNIEIKEQLEITNFKGQQIGLLNIELIPCDKKGKEYSDTDNQFVEDPSKLIGRDLHYIIKIENARGLPAKFTDMCAKYSMYDSENSTKAIKNTSNPDWKFKKQHSFSPATKEAVEYLENGAVIMQIWGKNKTDGQKKKGVVTRDIMQKTTITQNMAANSMHKTVDMQKMKFAMELSMAKKKAARAENKIGHMRQMIGIAEEHEKVALSTGLVKEILEAPTDAVAEKYLKMIPTSNPALPAKSEPAKMQQTGAKSNKGDESKTAKLGQNKVKQVEFKSKMASNEAKKLVDSKPSKPADRKSSIPINIKSNKPVDSKSSKPVDSGRQSTYLLEKKVDSNKVVDKEAKLKEGEVVDSSNNSSGVCTIL